MPPRATTGKPRRVATKAADAGTASIAMRSVRAFARRLADARGVSYAAEVAPGIYRGGQPDPGGIVWLRSLGIKTILNLRHYHGRREQAAVEAEGLRYLRVALGSSDAPAPAEVARILGFLRDPALHPIYVHCWRGADRTGAIMAVYRMEDHGWSNDEALAEMQHFDHSRLWRDLRRFVKTYRPAAAARAAVGAAAVATAPPSVPPPSDARGGRSRPGNRRRRPSSP